MISETMDTFTIPIVWTVLLFVQIINGGSHEGHSHPKLAMCKVESSSGKANYPIEGTITFEQKGAEENTSIEIDLKGFITDDAYDYHGFHIHSYGNLSNGCKAAGGHYNPMGVSHAGPSDLVRHVGDLGNIQESTSDVIKIEFSDHVISLYGEYSIIGRAVVIHETEDDLGRGNNEGSWATGNAGARLACCIIEEWHPEDPNKANTITSHIFIILSSFLFSLFLCL